MKLPKPLLPAIAMLASSSFGTAAVLVYEDYDYALADATTMNGVATAAIGFTGNYAVGGGGTGSSVYATTGLTFGANYLPTAGGAARLSANAGTGNSSILGATISVGGAQSGTLWSSYLVNFTAKETSFSGSTAQARVADAQTAGTGARMNALADNGSTFSTGISYDSGATTAGGSALTAGTTYLMLSQFTNVGTAGGGTATLWVFDLAGYDNWLSLGGGLEANLGTYDLASQSDTSATLADFGAASDFFQFAVSSTAGSGIQTVVYDELRWGTALDDVISTVPEPGTTAAMVGGLALLALLRRRPLAN